MQNGDDGAAYGTRYMGGTGRWEIRQSPKGKTTKPHHCGPNQRYMKLPERDRIGPRTADLEMEPNRRMMSVGSVRAGAGGVQGWSARKLQKSVMKVNPGRVCQTDPRIARAQQGPYHHPRGPFIMEPESRKQSCHTVSRLTPLLHFMLIEPPLTICLPTSLASERENMLFRLVRLM